MRTFKSVWKYYLDNLQKDTESESRRRFFQIENAKTVIQVPFHDILYFETSDIVHKVILYTKEEQVSF